MVTCLIRERFTDVSPADSYRAAIQPFVQAGGVGGDANGTFRPSNPVLRAHIIKMAVLD